MLSAPLQLHSDFTPLRDYPQSIPEFDGKSCVKIDMSKCKFTDFPPGHMSRLPQPQIPSLASVRRSGFPPETVECSSHLADAVAQRLKISGAASLEKTHWKPSGGSANNRGNHLAGQAKTQFGHHFGDRTSNETHIHHYYSRNSSASDLVADEPGSDSVGYILCTIESVVCGLSQYCDAVKTISRVRHLARSFMRLKRELETESDVLLNSVELLLKGNLPEEDLWSLLDNVQDQDQWQHPRVEEALRHQLGQSYSAFQESVAGFSEALKDLKDSLLISNLGEAPFVSDRRSARECIASLKFGLRMESYFSYLETIKARNEDIREIDIQDHMPEVVAPQRSCPSYETARAYSINIFMLLREAFVESCNAGHRVSLSLNPARHAQVKRLGNAAMATTSTVVLHHKVVGEKHSLPWTMEETEIRIVKSDAAHDEDFVDERSRRPKVRFQVPKATFALASEQARPHMSKKSFRECEQQAEIVRDLCKSLQLWRSTKLGNRNCLGYLSSVSGYDDHGLYWPSESIVKQGSATEITLAGALTTQRGRRLSLLDRRRLALALAVGTLQLYDTPWLSKQWGKNEIILFSNDGKMSASGPFVSVDMTHTEAGAQYFSRCRSIKNETIFALGVVLIELALKQPFEELKLPEDAEEGALHADFNAAVRLTKEVEYEAGSRYADVVRRCVWCEFDHNDVRLEDRKLQEKVYSGVVTVLQDELAYLEPVNTT